VPTGPTIRRKGKIVQKAETARQAVKDPLKGLDLNTRRGKLSQLRAQVRAEAAELALRAAGGEARPTSTGGSPPPPDAGMDPQMELLPREKSERELVIEELTKRWTKKNGQSAGTGIGRLWDHGLNYQKVRESIGDIAPKRAAAVSYEATVKLSDLIARWRIAPWLFVKECLGAEPDPWQAEVLRALVSGHFHIALKACKGPGKSTLLAWVIWWFMLCFYHPKILVTSVTGDNLRDGLWAELAKWRQAAEILQALFDWQTEKIYSREYPETWFASARTWPKEADTTKQATTLAGQHAACSMVIVDEAGGVPTGVLVAGLAHHSTQDPTAKETHYTLIAGNPDTIDSSLGWACTEDAANWWVKEITGDPDDPGRAPRIDIEWARRQIATFGADNPWVLVNVFGKFPPVSANKLVGSDHIRAAMDLTLSEQEWHRAPRMMTLDVARSTARDRSVLCRRQGPIVFPFITYRLDDTNELAGQVVFEFTRWQGIRMIIVDMVGIGGGVYDHLKALGLPVVGFNGGLPARDPRFVDRRTETWWLGAQAIKGTAGMPRLALPKDMELIPELTAPNVNFTRQGKMKLESKEDMLKRGVPSPDMGDALMMSFAETIFEDPALPESTAQALRRARPMAAEFNPFED
jgi:hypothetical protein